MFRSFLNKVGLSEYDFSHKLFPDVSDREYWDAYSAESIIRNAESFLDYSWPPITATLFMEFKRSGNRRIMETVHFERRQALVSLAFGELCENKGRFLEQIVNGLFLICEESYWGISAHWYGEHGNIPISHEPYIDLFAAETAEHISMICTLLREPLSEFCPEILKIAEYQLERRIKIPYLAHADYGWMGYENKPNNWNPWILSNLITVFLLFEKDRERLLLALNKMFTEIQHYYDRIPDDGGCDEGPDYWGKAGGSVFEFVYQLKLATGGALDLFGDKKLQKMAQYMKNVHIKGAYFVCFADCVPSKKQRLAPLVYGYGEETGDDGLKQLSREMYLDGKAELYFNPNESLRRNIICHEFSKGILALEQKEVSESCDTKFLQYLQVATKKCGDLILAAKGGHNRESHNHNDVGSFSLYDNGISVLADVGIGTYTKQTFSADRYKIPWVRSAYHNLPMINGCEQCHGIEHRADRFEVVDGKVVSSFAAAYDISAGIERLCREISLAENTLSFTDSFTFAENAGRAVREVLISALDVEISDNSALIGGKYRVTASVGSFSSEYTSFEGDKKLTDAWGCEGVTRIFIDTDGEGKITVTLTKL